MKKIAFLVLATVVIAFAQQPSPANNDIHLTNVHVTSSPEATIQFHGLNEGYFLIHENGELLIQIYGPKNEERVRVYRDGRVEGSNLDEGAKEFWRLMAKYAPSPCR